MKNRIQELYQIISNAEKELEQIRSECKHENTFFGNYAWAPGHINKGFICDDCGSFITSEYDFQTLKTEYNKLLNSNDFKSLSISTELSKFNFDYNSMSRGLNEQLNSMNDEELSYGFKPQMLNRRTEPFSFLFVRWQNIKIKL